MVQRDEIILHDHESGNEFTIREDIVMAYKDNPKKGVSGAVVSLTENMFPFDVEEVSVEIKAKLDEVRGSE